MSQKFELSDYKIEKVNGEYVFTPITSEQQIKLLADCHRKLSDENFSFVYDNTNITTSETSKYKHILKMRNEVFYIKMPKSYLEQNFFNVRTRYEYFFGPNNSHINVLIGNDETNKDGRIDRKNQGNAVRIQIGKDYQKWAEQNFKIGEYMQVEVFPNATIRLTKKMKEFNLNNQIYKSITI